MTNGCPANKPGFAPEHVVDWAIEVGLRWPPGLTGPGLISWMSPASVAPIGFDSLRQWLTHR